MRQTQIGCRRNSECDLQFCVHADTVDLQTSSIPGNTPTKLTNMKIKSSCTKQIGDDKTALTKHMSFESELSCAN